jgi:hypothetical protein
LDNDRFWYRVLTAKGSEFVMVDPARGTRTTAFDQQKFATALSKVAGGTYDPFAFRLQRLIILQMQILFCFL